MGISTPLFKTTFCISQAPFSLSSAESTLGVRPDLVHLFLAEWFKRAGDADILLQVREVGNAHNRSRYGIAQDVGQQLPHIQTPFDERTADDHFHGDHADLFFLGQAKEPVQVLWVVHDFAGGIEGDQLVS